MLSLTPEQEQAFRDHLQTVNARETCPLCDAGRWALRVVCGGEFLGRVCAQCGHVLLFDMNDVDQIAQDKPRFKRSAAAIMRTIERGRIEIGGIIQLDSKTVAECLWPTLEVLMDESLAVGLRSVGQSG